MIDREKVIKGLEEVDGYFHRMTEVCYRGDEATFCDLKEKVADALTLLKEQEAVPVRRVNGKRNHFLKCGKCNVDLMSGFNYCPKCGQAVKWE